MDRSIAANESLNIHPNMHENSSTWPRYYFQSLRRSNRHIWVEIRYIASFFNIKTNAGWIQDSNIREIKFMKSLRHKQLHGAFLEIMAEAGILLPMPWMSKVPVPSGSH